MAQGLVWAYCRVSTSKAEQELSLEQQQRWAREHASAFGYEVKIFEERASAKTILGRPVFQKMILDLQDLPAAKRPKQIIVTSLDRLSRDMTDTLQVARTLRDLRVELLVRDAGVIRADTFAQRAALVGQSMGGEAENEARSNRMKASWERRRREGKPTSNRVPYGLQMADERDIPAPDSSVWVLNAFRWYANGVGTPTIAQRFKLGAPPHIARVPGRVDTSGVPIDRVRNPVWEYNRILKLLRQSRYRGPIVPFELFDSVQQLLDSKPRWRQTRHAEYPLSGAVKCSTCGRSFHGSSTREKRKKVLADGTIAAYTAKRWRYYSCVVCGTRVKADWLEALFRKQVVKLSADPALLQKWIAGGRLDSRVTDCRREVADLERISSAAAIERARAKAWELALDGSFSAADLNAQLERISTKADADVNRLRSLKEMLARHDAYKRSLTEAKKLLDNFWPRYDSASYEDKRMLMATLTRSLGGVTADASGLTWRVSSQSL